MSREALVELVVGGDRYLVSAAAYRRAAWGCLPEWPVAVAESHLSWAGEADKPFRAALRAVIGRHPADALVRAVHAGTSRPFRLVDVRESEMRPGRKRASRANRNPEPPAEPPPSNRRDPALLVQQQLSREGESVGGDVG